MTIRPSGSNFILGASNVSAQVGVTDAGNFCFGGEVPLLVYDAKRNVTEVVCGQGVAPRLATPESISAYVDEVVSIFYDGLLLPVATGPARSPEDTP